MPVIVKTLSPNGVHRRRAAPEIVIHVRRRRLRSGDLADAGARFVTKPARNHDLPKITRPDPFDGFFDSVAGATLRTRLDDLVMPARRLDHFASLPDVVAHRFLNVNILVRLNGQNRGERMPMVGRRDGNSVKLRQLKQFSDVGKAFDFLVAFAERFHTRVQDFLIHVAQSEYPHAFLRQFLHPVDVVFAAPAKAHNGHADVVVRARYPRPRGSGQADGGGSQGCRLEKGSAIDRFHRTAFRIPDRVC